MSLELTVLNLNRKVIELEAKLEKTRADVIRIKKHLAKERQLEMKLDFYEAKDKNKG